MIDRTEGMEAAIKYLASKGKLNITQYWRTKWLIMNQKYLNLLKNN